MVSPVNEPGFLTRIVKRIREATQEVAHSEENAVPSEASEAAVRELKRKDDAVRRREFNYLRQVRAARIKDDPDLSVRVSAFQNSSTFNLDGQSIRGRAKTVKKIDAIEAELAQQWWSNDSIEASETRTPEESLSPKDVHFGVSPSGDMDLDFTGAGNVTPPDVIPTLPMQDALGAALDLFGQGQHDQAEAALVALLQSPQLDDKTAEACSAALLNLYRSTGARTSFDTVAIEYAQLFGRSAPEWRHSDISEQGDSAPANVDVTEPHLVWECPAVLLAGDMVALQAMAQTANVAVFDWSALQWVDGDAVQALLSLFTKWTQQTIALHFKGSDVMQNTLALQTPVGNRTTEAEWWQLRFEALRLLNAQVAFDDAAMDYCITFEISPPAWAAPLCEVIVTAV